MKGGGRDNGTLVRYGRERIYYPSWNYVVDYSMCEMSKLKWMPDRGGLIFTAVSSLVPEKTSINIGIVDLLTDCVFSTNCL